MKILELINTESPQTLNEVLKFVRGRWALVSKTTGRVLRYYKGSGKPSKEWVSKMERQIHSFENMNEQVVKLSDIYDADELNNESEVMYSFVTDEDLERDFQVRTMSPDKAKMLKTARGDETVFNSFNDYARKSQKQIVKDKIKHFDDNRIVVISGDSVLDGNHQVVASILSNKPLKYIDLSD